MHEAMMKAFAGGSDFGNQAKDRALADANDAAGAAYAHAFGQAADDLDSFGFSQLVHVVATM